MEEDKFIWERSEIDSLREVLERAGARINALETELSKEEKTVDQIITSLPGMEGIDKDFFRIFMKKPYLTIPRSAHEVLVIVPKFVNFQAGWLLRETESYNVFVFNQYSAWLGNAPKEILDLIGISKEFEKVTVTGDILEFDPEYREEIKNKFRNHLGNIRGNAARIIRGHEFEVIAEIVEAGALPFRPRPVDQADLRGTKDNPYESWAYHPIKLRDYQMEAYKKFMETGAIGVFLPTGSGKTCIALRIAQELRGKILVIVPTTTLKEQWEKRIKHVIGPSWDSFTVATYQAKNILNEKWALVIFDECQKLPANTFSKLALINAKYRIGLSASPFREDKREKYIIALTGFPVGIDWKAYMKNVGKLFHPVKVHIVKDLRMKIPYMKTLIDPGKKTLIFCDTIKLGGQIAKKLGCPHVYGETGKRMDTILNNNLIVISRVGDQGISIKNLDRIIEVDFLFGSRQQELQRTGRLMHSDSKEPQHDIIMTEEELIRYGKRLWALQEKGFRIQMIENGKAA